MATSIITEQNTSYAIGQNTIPIPNRPGGRKGFMIQVQGDGVYWMTFGQAGGQPDINNGIMLRGWQLYSMGTDIMLDGKELGVGDGAAFYEQTIQVFVESKKVGDAPIQFPDQVVIYTLEVN